MRRASLCIGGQSCAPSIDFCEERIDCDRLAHGMEFNEDYSRKWLWTLCTTHGSQIDRIENSTVTSSLSVPEDHGCRELETEDFG